MLDGEPGSRVLPIASNLIAAAEVDIVMIHTLSDLEWCFSTLSKVGSKAAEGGAWVWEASKSTAQATADGFKKLKMFGTPLEVRHWKVDQEISGACETNSLEESSYTSVGRVNGVVLIVCCVLWLVPLQARVSCTYGPSARTCLLYGHCLRRPTNKGPVQGGSTQEARGESYRSFPFR